MTLGEVAREREERAEAAPEAAVYSVTKHDGFVPSLEYFGRQVFSRDTANYRVVRRGDLAYATIHLDEGSLGLFDTADAGLISPMYTVLEVTDASVDARILFGLLKRPAMIAQIGRLGAGSVHRRKSILFSALSRTELNLPPPAEQRAIAAILEAIDEAIARSEEAGAAAEVLRQASLHELLTRGVPGRHTEWRSVPGVGTAPACWIVTTLGEVARFRSGQGARGSELVPQSERNRFAVFGGNGIAGYWPEALVSQRVVVIGRVGQKCGVVRTTDGPAWITDNALYNHTIDDGVSVDFLALVAQRARLNGIRNRNDLPLITQEIVHGVPVALPPRDEQDAITSILETCDSAIASSQHALVAIVATKEAVSDALLTGRVRSSGTPPAMVPA